MTVEYILQSAKNLPREQYLEVKYEDFVARPAEIFEQVAEKCDLVWQDDFLQAITAGMDNRNFKWRREMSDEDQKTPNALLEKFLMQLGYEA
jgi:hypothetical protein